MNWNCFDATSIRYIFSGVWILTLVGGEIRDFSVLYFGVMGLICDTWTILW